MGFTWGKTRELVGEANGGGMRQRPQGEVGKCLHLLIGNGGYLFSTMPDINAE